MPDTGEPWSGRMYFVVLVEATKNLRVVGPGARPELGYTPALTFYVSGRTGFSDFEPF